jgi:hypothetical protein
MPKSIFGKELWELILCCVIKPGNVGFNLGDVEIMKNLPQEVHTAFLAFFIAQTW